MKKTTLYQIFLCSVCSVVAATSVSAQQFVDCSDGNGNCDVLYSSDSAFIDGAEQKLGLLKTDDQPLAESRPSWIVEDAQNYRVVLPKGATQTSDAGNPIDGTVVVPGYKTNSRVDVMPDGSVRTTTVEIIRKNTADGNGYQETKRRIERLESEKTGAVWVEKTLADKVDYGDRVHDWEAAQGETLKSLLVQWGEVSGWTVVWKLDRDYKLEAGVVFRGTFTEVASAIIRTFARAVPAPIGTFYKGNRVLVVSVQEDENAH